MNSFTKSACSVALGAALLAPAVAGAAGLTSSQVSAIVSLLQSFNADANTVAGVQAVLSGQPPHMGDIHMPLIMMGSTTSSSTLPAMHTPLILGKACPILVRNLGLGAKGDDVKKLQDMLKADPSLGFAADSTGTFGPMTMKAMMRFQQANGITAGATGSVGPLTRGILERRCGKGGEGQDDYKGMMPPSMMMQGGSTTTIPMMGQGGER